MTTVLNDNLHRMNCKSENQLLFIDLWSKLAWLALLISSSNFLKSFLDYNGVERERERESLCQSSESHAHISLHQKYERSRSITELTTKPAVTAPELTTSDCSGDDVRHGSKPPTSTQRARQTLLKLRGARSSKDPGSTNNHGNTPSLLSHRSSRNGTWVNTIESSA